MKPMISKMVLFPYRYRRRQNQISQGVTFETIQIGLSCQAEIPLSIGVLADGCLAQPLVYLFDTSTGEIAPQEQVVS